jgi:hypothetical protein
MDNNSLKRISLLETNNVILKSNNVEVKKDISEDTSLHLGLLANPAKIVNNGLGNFNITSDTSTESSDTTNRRSSSSSDDSTTSRRRTTTTKQNIPTFNIKKPISNPSFTSNNLFNNVKTEKKHSPKLNPTFKPPSNIPKNPQIFEVKKELSPQELKMRKIELLRKLSEIKSKGFELSKDYSFNSSIEEMEYEYELLKSFANKRQGVKLYKNVLLNAVSAMEFMNDKYDPFSFQLSGWSEHVSVEVDSWDDIIEEIYEKYKGTGQNMAPELKLMLLMSSSAAAFHHSKSTFKNIPGLDKIIENNPNILNKVTTGFVGSNRTDSQFMTRQEIHLNKQRDIQSKRDAELRKLQKDKIAQSMSLSSINRNIGNINLGPPIVQKPPEIKAPINVKNILARMKKNNSNDSTSTEDSSSNNRIVSHDRVNSDSLTSSAKRRGRKKNNVMKIST